jgi:hypothetical protein
MKVLYYFLALFLWVIILLSAFITFVDVMDIIDFDLSYKAVNGLSDICCG